MNTKIRSHTYTTHQPWDLSLEKEITQSFSFFFQDLKSKNLVVLGCLQSFTFPNFYSDENAFQIADCISSLYRKTNCILLGGDTSHGTTLVITVIALIK